MIVDHAGGLHISVGSLCQYFPNKEAILFRLQADEWQDTSAMLERILCDSKAPPFEAPESSGASIPRHGMEGSRITPSTRYRGAALSRRTRSGSELEGLQALRAYFYQLELAMRLRGYQLASLVLRISTDNLATKIKVGYGSGVASSSCGAIEHKGRLRVR